MSKETNDSLNELLGIEEEEIVPQANTQIVPAQVNPVPAIQVNSVEDDFEYSRSVMKELIETGKNSLTELRMIARDTEQPRAYEVTATLIKEMRETAKEIMELHQKKNEINGEVSGGGMYIDKAIFQGTPAELLRKVKKEIQNK